MIARWSTIGVAWLLGVGLGVASAQIAMPDPREMAGIPRPVPVGDLPNRTVSVRLIRGALSNNIAGHPVELVVDGQPRMVTTDENGRAEFGPLTPGARLRAVAVVDGERLESQEFPAPAEGGIRVMLVATDKEREARDAERARAPAVTGTVSIARDSQIVVEPDEEMVRVYYLLSITNTSATPINPATPFAFDVPTGAVSTTIMEGSSPQAAVTGTRVRVQGPFAPGATFAQVAFILPTPLGVAEISQVFPATLDHLAVIVKKAGEAKLEGPQLVRQQEMPAGGQTYIAAAGDRPVAAGQAVQLTVSGLPHHSPLPRYIALGMALGIAGVGVWAARRGKSDLLAEADRKRIVSTREKLFQELVRMDTDVRKGRLDATRAASRREALVVELEQIYAALDTLAAGDPAPRGPAPAGRAGLTA